MAMPPFALIDISTSCNRSTRLAAMATLTPEPASAVAMALPIPLDAPVTMAT